MFAPLVLIVAVIAAGARPAVPAKSAPARPFLAVPGMPAPPGSRGAQVAHRPLATTLAGVLKEYPADSLAGPLRELEQRHDRDSQGADAAFVLGQFHYARGEYRQAAEAFARAAARFSPERKPEARYWQGLSALGLHDPVLARAALEEVEQSTSPRRDEARFAVALAWEQAGHPDRATEVLEPLVASGAGELAPAALEHLAGMADRLGQVEVARSATERLRREYPQSIEATRLPQPPPPAPAVAVARPTPGSVGVQIGAFADPARARALLDAAKRGGFPHAELVVQGQGEARLHVVRIGWFATEEQARRAGEAASRGLGIAYRLVREP
jgi:cell division septation protein DedD